jgi:hypothetical protein
LKFDIFIEIVDDFQLLFFGGLFDFWFGSRLHGGDTRSFAGYFVVFHVVLVLPVGLEEAVIAFLDFLLSEVNNWVNK